MTVKITSLMLRGSASAECTHEPTGHRVLFDVSDIDESISPHLESNWFRKDTNDAQNDSFAIGMRQNKLSKLNSLLL